MSWTHPVSRWVAMFFFLGGGPPLKPLHNPWYGPKAPQDQDLVARFRIGDGYRYMRRFTRRQMSETTYKQEVCVYYILYLEFIFIYIRIFYIYIERERIVIYLLISTHVPLYITMWICARQGEESNLLSLYEFTVLPTHRETPFVRLQHHRFDPHFFFWPAGRAHFQ